MANWMIRLGESYLAVMYDYLHRLLYRYHVFQADETPVLVNKDGRTAGSKSWMWVYRSGFMYPEKQIILYEYQKTRNASHPEEGKLSGLSSDERTAHRLLHNKFR